MTTPSDHGESATLRRFDTFDRFLHGFLMLSFLGLSFTGVPLLFAHTDWASRIVGFFGGFSSAATLHRTFAFVMITVFLIHVTRLVRRLWIEKDFGLLWGPRSLIPQPRDVVELYQHLRWFVGLGPRPRFDHWTYWEKFDYWAVFWGMGIIGGSGLLLWFPKLFSNIVPGWVFNIALLIHGEEALLAVVFIFTIHFFNGHIRPEKFPMDTVIFTGRISIEEIREERAGEFERLGGDEGLRQMIAPPPRPWSLPLGRTIGTAAVLLGLGLVTLSIWALVQAG